MIRSFRDGVHSSPATLITGERNLHAACRVYSFAVISGDNGAIDSPERRQAAYFRRELLRELGDLDRQVAKLQATIRRQSVVRALHDHLVNTEADLNSALTQRAQLVEMLAALSRPNVSANGSTGNHA